MKQNGGYATLGFLNQEVLKVAGPVWKTKTPFASIRRIVQDPRFFFKIRPGLWALNEYKDKLPFEVQPPKGTPQQDIIELTHSYYQGLLIEIGNLNNLQTAIPAQDKNKLFLPGRKLGDIATIKDFHKFSYENLVRRAQTIDVTWFNNRNMPDSFFEVEHKTDFINSLLKFVDLRDFNVKFMIVANKVREREFNSKLSSEAFQSIKKKVVFLDYDELSEFYSQANEFKPMKKKFSGE